MKSYNRIPAVAAAAFAASLSFSIVACDDSSSASGDDVPGSSDSGTALGSSGSGDVPGSSGSVPAGMEGLPDDVLATYSIIPQCGDETMHPEGSCNTITGADGKAYLFECVGTKWEYNQDCEEPMCLTPASKLQHPECQFPECNADSEGLVHVRVTGNPKYGQRYVFYRCEQGKWAERSAWVECDTAGVTEGAVCQVRVGEPGYYSGFSGNYAYYEYVGNGVWKDFVSLGTVDKTCTAENDGDVEKITYGNETGSYTEYYKCKGLEWVLSDVLAYNCPDTASVGDTCSFELDGEKKYYVFETDYGDWVKATYDSAYGYCSTVFTFRKYQEVDGEYYYCEEGRWSHPNLIPHQYTDPRKDSLTDEEFDVLDLPKDAKVGDRVGGLLETCYYDVMLDYDGIEQKYDFCVPAHYYRYREDGSWTEETHDELYGDDVNLDSLPCGGSTWCCAETEGMKYRSHEEYYEDEPQRIYQCVSGEIEFVEYVWSRYEKK